MRIHSFWSFFTVFLIVPALSGAQTFGGIGTRAEGMGGAFVAVADDASAVYWNPAGMATGATFDFQFSTGDTTAGSPLFVGAVMPVLGVSHYRTHTVPSSPDRQNDGSGKVQIRTLRTANTGITVVQTVVSGLVVGTTARLVRGGMDPFQTRTTIDFDAGAIVSMGNIRVGITGRNLRQPEFEGEFGPLALTRQVRAGIALAPRSLPTGVHGPFSVAFDADLTRTSSADGNLRMAAAGGEYWLGQGRVGARGGVRWSTSDSRYRAISGGITVKLPRSVFAEAHVTKPDGSRDAEWSVGARMTF
jgi:hypothetical protein